MTKWGGTYGNGNIFSIDTSGGNFENLYQFYWYTTGDHPLGDVILSGKMLYGMNYDWGPGGGGIAFKFDTCTLSLATTVTNINCHGGNNGSASVTTIGAGEPFTYSWSNGGTSGLITGLSAGTYSVTVSSSCGRFVSASVTITQPATLPFINIATFKNDCGGGTGSATAIAATGGTPSYKYKWTPTGGTNLTASNLTAGTYTITVTDAHGCTATASVTISQPASPLSISILSKTNVPCYGGTGSIIADTAIGGFFPYSYLWTPSGGTTLNASNLTAGTYTVTTTDINGCLATTDATITQPAAAIAISIISQTNCICYGDTGGAIANAATGGTSPYSYLWKPNGGTSLIATNLTAGIYTVNVTDINGCMSSATVNITQPPAIIPAISLFSGITCHGDSDAVIFAIASGGSGFYVYKWSDPLSQTNSVATGLSPNSYTVTVTDNNGCIGTSSMTITQPASLGIITDSLPDNGSCNGSAWVIVNGGTSPYNFLWSGGQTTDTIKNQCAGSYCCAITDANGCIDSTCVIINLTTGTRSAEYTSKVIVSPNPNNGLFTVQSSVAGSPLSIEIYDFLGEKIYARFNILNSLCNIDLSSKSAGIYFYRVLNFNGRLIGEGKIIITK